MPKRRIPRSAPTGRDFPKYSITTVTDMTGVPAQQLRRYEQSGMLTPERTEGGVRRYSDDDVCRVERIRDLAETGANQTGIEQILALQDALAASEQRAQVAEARAQTAEAETERLHALLHNQEPPAQEA
jgi:MerR family transcriptional regulator/heat shock protein HspR